jgi:hypothetical protein
MGGPIMELTPRKRLRRPKAEVRSSRPTYGQIYHPIFMTTVSKKLERLTYLINIFSRNGLAFIYCHQNVKAETKSTMTIDVREMKAAALSP